MEIKRCIAVIRAYFLDNSNKVTTAAISMSWRSRDRAHQINVLNNTEQITPVISQAGHGDPGMWVSPGRCNEQDRTESNNDAQYNRPLGPRDMTVFRKLYLDSTRQRDNGSDQV